MLNITIESANWKNKNNNLVCCYQNKHILLLFDILYGAEDTNNTSRGESVCINFTFMIFNDVALFKMCRL